MRCLSSVVLLALVLVLGGCSAKVGGFGEEIAGSGDSDQDVLECEGQCEVSQTPETGAWTAKTTSPDARLRWVTNTQVNADRDVAINELWRDGMLQAVEVGKKAASPGP